MSNSNRASMPQVTMTHVARVIQTTCKKIRAGDMLTREEQFPILILGLPGWGKTRIPEAKFGPYKEYPHSRSLILSIPEYIEDDLNVLSVVEGKLVQLALPKIIELVDQAKANPTIPFLLMFDELPQGSTQVAKIIAKYCNEREISGISLPDNVVMVATGNQRKHQAGAGSALSHLISRFKVYEIKPDIDGWLDWGARILHQDVLAYVHMKPTASYCWQDDATDEAMAQQYRDAAKDWIPYPNARSWTSLSMNLHADPSLSVEDFASFVGPERAGEFHAMRGIQIPSHADLLEGRAELPEEPMGKWVAVIRCGQLLTPGNAEKTARLMKNLNPELVEVGLKICGKTALQYLKSKGVQVANGYMALVQTASDGGAYYFPGFSKELLAPGSRYLAMLEVN